MTDDLILLFGGKCSERRVSVASAQHVTAVLPQATPWFWAPDDRVFEIAASALVAHAQPFEVDFIANGAPATRA